MAAAMLSDILDEIMGVERKLNERYADIRDRTRDSDTRLLCYYLGRWRRGVRSVHGGLDDLTLARVRATALPEDLTYSPAESTSLLDMPVGDVSSAMLLEHAVQYHRSLMALVQGLMAQGVAPEVEDLLGDLLRIQKRELGILGKMRDMKYFL